MFESIMNFFKKLGKSENNKEAKSKQTAKDRLHLVLMQDRANVSADFLEMMKQEIIEVIKKYIEVDEKEIDVRLTNEVKEDGTTGAPSLYANIPIVNIRNEMKKEVEAKAKEEEASKQKVEDEKKEEENKVEDKKEKTEEIIEEENKPEEKEDKEEDNKVEESEEEKKENNEN
ncbi:MAG: cell division topological specificity factor MinE [Clostridia bacterium]